MGSQASVKAASIAVALGALAITTGTAFANHERPIGGAKYRTNLVPVFRECTTPNNTSASRVTQFGNAPSCSAPVPESDNVILTTNDSTTGAGTFVVKLRCNNAGTPPDCGVAGDQLDFGITASMSDVQCALTSSAATSCGAANTSPRGPDYTGLLLATLRVRITDHDGTSPADQTIIDVGLGSSTLIPSLAGGGLTCTGTAGTLSAGSNCSLSTTADALVANTVIEGKRAIYDLVDPAVVRDAGDDGALTNAAVGACPPLCAPTGDENRFLRQGVFAP